MAKIRIERALIKEYGLWMIRADHLSLVFQQDEFDNGQSQEIWRVVEGTRDILNFGAPVLGVGGVKSPVTLSSENGNLTGDALRGAIGTPKSRGSTELPSFTPASDWANLLAVGREIDDQNYPYLIYNLPSSPLPTANSSSVVASLMYYIGIDIAQHMPAMSLSFTVGTRTLLGTFDDDFLQLTDLLSFDTILSGEGQDRLEGTDNVTITEKFYGGRDDDVFDWSHGANLYHGGQADLDYALDGNDRVNYAGIGTVIILAGDHPVPHFAPDYLALHGGFVDKLFSIDELSWHDESDTVLFGEGVKFENVRLELDLKLETPDSPGDILDFSDQTSGLLSAPSDRPDVVLVGKATEDGEFTDGGFWARSLEMLIGSEGDDRFYAGSTLRGLEGNEGNDVLSGRTASALTGASPLGYDIELSGGEGDDTIISGTGRSYAIGGAGADTFVLSSLSDSDRTTEFVIEGADSTDRLLVPFDFLVPDAGPFDGSELFPILAAISPVIGGATFGNLPQNPGPGPLGGFDEPGFFYLAGQVPLDGSWSGSWDGRINITDQVVFNRDGNDLLIHVWNTGEIYGQAFLTIGGQDFVFQEVDPDPITEAVIRVVDFSEGMLGIRFYELGEETPFPFPGGSGTPDSNKLWNTAQFTLAGNTLLSEALEAEPETPIFDQPSEGETDVRDVISGNEQDNDLIVVAAAQIPGQFVSGADLSGGGGNDTLTGGTGRDTLDGGSGDDILAGGRGDDRYIVDSAGDVVTEAATSGFDSVVASINFVLPENVEDLTLTGTATSGQGNAGNNLIRGNDSANVLTGLGGNDRLVGGRGNDLLDGGTGDDLYVYSAGDGNDTIVSGGATPGIDALKIVGFTPEQVQAFQSASGTDVILRLVDGSRIALADFFAGGSIAAVGFDNDFVWDAAAISTAAIAAGSLLNDAPVAGDDLGIVAGASSIVISKALLLANDRDLDGDTLSIVAVESLTAGLSAGLTVDGDVEVSALPGLSGIVELNYSVSDGNGGITTARINITLVENQAPIVSGEPIGDIDVEPGIEFSFDIPVGMFTDADSDDLFVSATLADGSDLPAWLTFDAVSQSFDGLVPEDFDGELIIQLTADDGFAVAETVFTLRSEGTITGLTLVGTSVANVLEGGSGPDEFFGLGGNDTLLAGDGDDTFWATGNAGYDIYDGGAGFDTIRGGAGNDTIGMRGLTVAGPLGTPVQVLLAGIEAIEGGDGFDILQFENTPDVIDLSAIDVSGIERISAAGGSDTVIGTAGNDVIDGGGHHDFLFGGAGDDTFMFSGAAGFDFYDGGEGFDVINGSAGNDILALRNGSADLLSIEAIDFGGGFDILRMHTANDILDLSGVDVAGLEQIEGGAGADWIRGSSGNEILFGGTRQDTFVFSGFFGQDTIADFQLQLHPRVNGDLIDLSSFGFSSYLDVLELTHESNGHSVIQLAQADSSITILNVAKSLLQADDFIL